VRLGPPKEKEKELTQGGAEDAFFAPLALQTDIKVTSILSMLRSILQPAY